MPTVSYHGDMARNWETNPHPLAGSYRTLANGRKVWLDERGKAHLVSPSGNLVGAQHWDEDAAQEEAAHADYLAELRNERYWEERGDSWYVGSQEEARERYLEGLAEQRQQDRLDARDEAREWGGEDIPS